MHKALTISGYAQFEGKMFCSEADWLRIYLIILNNTFCHVERGDFVNTQCGRFPQASCLICLLVSQESRAPVPNSLSVYL